MFSYKNSALSSEKRAADLLSRMSLKDKIGQTHQLPARDENREKINEQVREGRIGSLILAGTAFAGNDEAITINHKVLNELQSIAVNETQWGIPMIFGRDVIHGHRTVFPIPLAQAASFKPEQTRLASRVAAEEASAEGVHWTFAPMVDISRDPRWGRIAESYGEDPYLSGKMGAASVKGFQGDKLENEDSLLACAKHYVGYGAAEGGRDYNTAEISDHTLRNIYLPPFQACCEAGCASIMSGFHDLNGESVSGSRYLLTNILRDEWKWDGFVVSDWGSVYDLINHGMAEGKREAAFIGMNAGVDMDMCSSSYLDYLEPLAEENPEILERIDKACFAVLLAKFRKGLFERPFIDLEKAKAVHCTKEHLEIAEKTAAACAVLLKNEGSVLPLQRKPKSVVLGGPFIEDRRSLLGCWTLDGIAEETPNFVEAWQELAPETLFTKTNPSLIDQSFLHFAGQADTVVLILGEDQSLSGELNSVADISLLESQVILAKNAHSRGKKVVALVLCGRPMVLTELEPWCDAILVGWHPGSRGAHAMVKLLFGDLSPQGHLPATFPRHTGQIPIHYNYKPTGKQYGRTVTADDSFRNVLEKYIDVPGQPLYPFGWGLTYTSFKLSDFSIASAPTTVEALLNKEKVKLSIAIRNTGSREGTATIQVYVRDCVASVTRPVRELKAFSQHSVPQGDSVTVEMELDEAAFGFYNREGKWTVEPGKFQVSVGMNSLELSTVEISIQ